MVHVYPCWIFRRPPSSQLPFEPSTIPARRASTSRLAGSPGTVRSNVLVQARAGTAPRVGAALPKPGCSTPPGRLASPRSNTASQAGRTSDDDPEHHWRPGQSDLTLLRRASAFRSVLSACVGCSHNLTTLCPHLVPRPAVPPPLPDPPPLPRIELDRSSTQLSALPRAPATPRRRRQGTTRHGTQDSSPFFSG